MKKTTGSWMRLSYLAFYICTLYYSASSYGTEILSAAQLDEVTAGNSYLPVKIDHTTARGTHIVIDGDIQLQNSTQNSSLSLSDNAQQYLTSLININAVNAPVNVLLNLNININSTVGNLQQYNFNGELPSK